MIAIKQLVLLDTEARSERFIWVDWRSFETEIVEGVAEFLGEEDSLGCDENGDGLVVFYNGHRYDIPLTASDSDRYVVISSLAEMLKDKYVLWLDKESAEGADTHGLLLLTHAQSEELQRDHADWIAKNLLAFEPGVDRFSGLKVPFLHHSDHNPEFAVQKQAMQRRDRVVVPIFTATVIGFCAAALLLFVALIVWML